MLDTHTNNERYIILKYFEIDFLHENSRLCPIIYTSYDSHLRNEFVFWKVHGIMNTSGLLQS